MNKNGSLISSFRNAISGIINLVSFERNAQIHLIATLLAVFFGVWLKISSLEWITLMIVIALVWAFELMNTSIEKLCDFIHPEQNKSIKVVKDLSAGGVLVAAVLSVVVGLLIFLSPLIEKLRSLFV